MLTLRVIDELNEITNKNVGKPLSIALMKDMLNDVWQILYHRVRSSWLDQIERDLFIYPDPQNPERVMIGGIFGENPPPGTKVVTLHDSERGVCPA